MNARELHQVLADPVARHLYETLQLARLAYTAKDGSPRIVPIGYMFKDDAFVVCTATNARKLRALSIDPRVALTIDTAEAPPKVLLVRGTASIEIVDGIPQEYLEINRRGAASEEAFAEFEAAVRGLYPQMARIEITPTWAKVLDFETRFPQALEELMAQASGGS
jgi:predicted pyridoxine 5'-phosphate oxidase superfamily flavin-nucleotide-binding protein